VSKNEEAMPQTPMVEEGKLIFPQKSGHG
jgi:hypothetical protein